MHIESGAAPKERKNAAHGASRGCRLKMEPSPGGAEERALSGARAVALRDLLAHRLDASTRSPLPG
jgi:hypothetical protein